MTTRASPSHSFDAACRHLFRHLREPSELRRNPLVGTAFSPNLKGIAKKRADEVVARAIRDAVRRCADVCLQSDRIEDEENAARRYAIVVDCDVEGMPRSRLAARLGVSARHYTRLQHDVRRRVAVLLSSEMARTERARTAAFEPEQSPLHRSAMLAGKGLAGRALDQLEAIARECGDARLAASALCHQALIRQRYIGDVAEANRVLAAARAVVEKLAAGDPARRLAAAEIELAAIEIDIAGGRFEGATQSAAVLAQTLRGESQAERWLRFRALPFAAYGEFVSGKRDASLRWLGDVLLDAGASAHAPPQERVEHALWIAVVLAALGRPSDSLRTLAGGWLSAQQGNLTLDVIRLDLVQTMMALECGAVSTATERLAGICEETRRFACPNVGAEAHAYLARAQMRATRPQPGAILDSAQRALAASACESPVWIEGKVAEAFARLLLRDVPGAERAARRADDAAATMRNRACRGNTLRELARVAYAQGRRRDAKRAIMAAVEAGYAVGKPQQTAQALELAAQILREPAYRREAAALRNALSLAGAR